MSLHTPQNQLFSASGSHAPTPGQSLRSFSQELLQASAVTGDRRVLNDNTTPSSKPSARTHSQKSQRSQESHSVGHSGGTATSPAAAAQESQVVLLQQQLTQVLAELKRSQRTLEERESELTRCEAALAASKETLASKDVALSETRRVLAEKDAALREKDAQLTALEARHEEAMSLTGQQVAAARASRDEELERIRIEAEGGKAATAAEYETMLARGKVAEAELRSGTQRLREENEALRSAVQKAEARAAEAELSAQRAVSKFESAVGTIRQLEEQYESLSKDADAADQLRRDRILALEAEIEGLRVAKAELAQERDEAIATASQHAQQALAEAREAVQRHQRSEIAAGDATAALTKVKKQLEDMNARCSAAEAEADKWRQEAAAMVGDLERQKGAYNGAQSLLEASKLALEAARREAEGLGKDLERQRTAAVEAEARASAAVAAMETAREEASLYQRERDEMDGALIRQKRAAKEAEERAETAETAAKEALDKVEKLQKEVEKLVKELSEAEKRQEELQEALDEAKAELKAAKDAAAINEATTSSLGEEPRESPGGDVFSQLQEGSAENAFQTPHSGASLAPGSSALPKTPGTIKEEELVAENSRLRRQLASFKLSLLSSPAVASPSVQPARTTAAGGGYVGGGIIGDTRASATISGTASGIGASGFGTRRPAAAGGGTGGSLWGTSALSRGATAAAPSAAVGSGSADDALAKARRQVMLAKEYLNQVANMGPDAA